MRRGDAFSSLDEGTKKSRNESGVASGIAFGIGAAAAAASARTSQFPVIVEDLVVEAPCSRVEGAIRRRVCAVLVNSVRRFQPRRAIAPACAAAKSSNSCG